MELKIYKSVAEISEAEWDAIVGKNKIFCAHKFVSAVEKSVFDKGGCYYPVIYDDGKIVAHACVYFYRTELDLFARGVLKKAINLIRKRWKNLLVLESLECGSPAALGNTISIRDGVDCAGTMRELSRGIEELAKELGVKFILFRDFYDQETELHNIFRDIGYMKIHNLPKAEMKIKWKDFDEYLNSMRSNYRRKIVKRMDKFSGANITFDILTDFSEYAPVIKRLYDNVYHNAKEYKRERMAETFFRDIDKYLGEKSVMVIAKKDGKPIGASLLLLNDKMLISSFMGLDYDYNEEYFVYFNLFYKTIELAIEKGMDEIELGITTLDPKRDMGADVVALNMYMRHANPFLNKIIPILFDMITAPDTTTPRNVFKEGLQDRSGGSAKDQRETISQEMGRYRQT